MSSQQRKAAVEVALEVELGRIVESGEYAAWFAKQSVFHRYSPTNSMWILAQRPDASRVASYRTWQQVGRQVRRGERGIVVFHPKPFWVDPATGRRVRPPTTDAGKARLVRKVSFGTGYVFDISQTDGESLTLGRPAPADAPKALLDHLEGYCSGHGITVATKLLRAGLSGYYRRDGDTVVVSSATSAGERAATLAHELAHREDPELIAAHDAGDGAFYAHNRSDCEAVAEASAHAISARFGHDITAASAGYIAAWVDGDIDRFKQMHGRVGQVTRRLVPPDRLDRTLAAGRDAAHQKARQRHQTARGGGRR